MARKNPAAPADSGAPNDDQQPAQEMTRGRALIDIEDHGMKCGEYGSLPSDIAEALRKDGRFDPDAPFPEE